MKNETKNYNYYLFKDNVLFELNKEYRSLKDCYMDIYFNKDFSDNLDELTKFEEYQMPFDENGDMHIVRYDGENINLFVVPNSMNNDSELVPYVLDNTLSKNSIFNEYEGFDNEVGFIELFANARKDFENLNSKSFSTNIHKKNKINTTRLLNVREKLFGNGWISFVNQTLNLNLKKEEEIKEYIKSTHSNFYKLFVYLYYAKHPDVLSVEVEIKEELLTWFDNVYKFNNSSKSI